jgi:hypothetical protein
MPPASRRPEGFIRHTGKAGMALNLGIASDAEAARR